MKSQRKPNQLSRAHFWTLCLSILALWITGMGWLFLHNFWQIQTEFGITANPAEHWLIRLHGFFLLPALVALGGILFAHIPGSWSFKAMKLSGLAQIALYAILVATGYALYYAGNETVRDNASLIHWGIGSLAPAIFIWHYLSRKKQAKAKD